MSKNRIISIVVLAVGVVALIVGAVFLMLKLNATPAMADGDYLVSKGKWILEDGSNCAGVDEVIMESNAGDTETEVATGETNCIGGSGVIWTFTEIGKGTLTTNSHTNDYGFRWALEDEHMIVQTDWLYELDNEYKYELDQGAGVLTLSDKDGEYRFVAQSE